jgi:predicted aldo/keto reductase-like oxidoreductase
MNNFNRRQFLKSSILGTSSALLAMPAFREIGRTGVDRKVITRKLGKTGIERPIVSFGVMRADNPALIPAALELGVKHFDTAHGYQRGKNEEMLGKVLKDHRRDSFVIATKVPPEDGNRDGTLGSGSTSKAFLQRLDTSLERLEMDYVDILYVHGIVRRDAALFPAMLEAVQTAKKAGKARFVGMSTHKNEPEVIQAAIDSGVYDVVLTSVNFKQDHYPELKRAIANAAKAGIGIIAMKPMAGAFHDREKKKPINCKAALKFVLQDENVTTSIPGITTFDQLVMNASINQDLALTDEERADLTYGKSESGLYCQACEHCVPDCPKGLPIPEIMRAYMYTYGYGQPDMAHTLLASLDLPEDPCSACGRCTAACVKGFDLAERITDISRLTRIPGEFLS